MLYPKQEHVASVLYRGYKHPELNEGHLYLSGEMGSGKTYIASSIANKLNAKHALIICPPAVVKKWAKVYQEFNEGTVKIATAANTKTADLANVTIVSQKNAVQVYRKYFKLINKKEDTSDFDNLLRDAKDLPKSTTDLEYQEFQVRLHKFEYELPNFDFVIFDEIHTYKSTLAIFGLFALLEQTKTKTLSLTGTIFNQNLEYLASLLSVSNHKLVQCYADSQSYDCFLDTEDLATRIESYSWFNYYIWRYIAAQISLSDVQNEVKTNKDEIKQKIMPLEGIQLSPEQAAWIDIVKYAGNDLTLSSKRIDKIITTYLDRPSQKVPMITRNHALNVALGQSISPENAGKRKSTEEFLLSLQLTPLKINETKKFEQLANLLKKPEKTIIFVQDSKLLQLIPEVLPRTASLPSNTAKTTIAEKINNLLKEDYDNIVLTTKQVSTGVDINIATRIIWYQVPNDVATIIQAQRRVLRLNSTKSSKVYFLFYLNTTQEKIIKQVSESAVKNAASYNVQTKSNLAKLSHILFEDIK